MLRKKRIRTFREKNRVMLLLLKCIVVCYVAVFGVSYITSDTSAYYSKQTKVSQKITAGTWEEADESLLKFIDKGNQNIKACPAKMKVTLKNTGKGPMLQTSVYEIYYVENGNPKKHGQKVLLNKGEDVVKVLDKGEKVELTYQTDKPGRYIFKAYQAGDHDEKKAVWSKEIKVTCKKETDKKAEEKEKAVKEEKTEKSTETKHPDKPAQNNAESNTEKTKTTPDVNMEKKKEKVEDSSQQAPDREKQQANESAEKNSTEEKSAEKKTVETKAVKPDAETNKVQQKVNTTQNKEGAVNEEAENTEVGK